MADTNMRALFRERGFGTTSAVERAINRPDAHKGWLDDELRKARKNRDLPSLRTLIDVATVLDLPLAELLQIAAEDAERPLVGPTDPGVDARRVADLMAHLPPPIQVWLRRGVEQLVRLLHDLGS